MPPFACSTHLNTIPFVVLFFPFHVFIVVLFRFSKSLMISQGVRYIFIVFLTISSSQEVL